MTKKNKWETKEKRISNENAQISRKSSKQKALLGKKKNGKRVLLIKKRLVNTRKAIGNATIFFWRRKIYTTCTISEKRNSSFFRHIKEEAKANKKEVSVVRKR